MKKGFIFLLLLMVVCGNVFSQTIRPVSFPYLFTVNKNEFKITQAIDTIQELHTEYCYRYDLQKIDTGWHTIYGLGTRCTDKCCSTFLSDINNDSFPDVITLATLWNPLADVFLYNPVRNDFDFSGSFFLNKDSTINIKVIDKTNEIYYDWGNDNTRPSIWYSCLFQIKDYERINLGIITNEKDSITRYRNFRGEKLPDIDIIARATKVYKIKNKNTIIDNVIFNFYDKSKVKEIEIINNKDFDYATYWKNNWQKFLPQKN